MSRAFWDDHCILLQIWQLFSFANRAIYNPHLPRVTNHLQLLHCVDSLAQLFVLFLDGGSRILLSTSRFNTGGNLLPFLDLKLFLDIFLDIQENRLL